MKIACAPQSDMNIHLEEQHFLYKSILIKVKNHKITHAQHTETIIMNYINENNKPKIMHKKLLAQQFPSSLRGANGQLTAHLALVYLNIVTWIHTQTLQVQVP